MNFSFLLNNALEAAEFAQRITVHSGVSTPKEIASLIQMGIDDGDLEAHTIGEGQNGRVYIANCSSVKKGKAMSRLIRNDDRRRSMVPNGDLMGMELPEAYTSAVTYLSNQWFRPNNLILETGEKLAASGYFDEKKDQMELLMLAEFKRFGVDPYRLPMFPDFRYRLYTDSRGVASYQGGDWHRAVCDFASPLACDEKAIDLALRAIADEYKVTEDNYRDILADPVAFIRESGFKKPACSLRAAEAIRELVEAGTSAYILQFDQTNSGAAIYAWLTGDKNLARLTNWLPSEVRQDLYNAACQLVKAGRLLPEEVLNVEIFYERSTGKLFIVPMMYGAANESLTRSLVLADPQKDRVQLTDEIGMYIPGSIEGLPDDRLNSTHAEFFKNLSVDKGWDHAIAVASDIAKAFELAIYGDAKSGITGLTSRLRPAMTGIKKAARIAAQEGRILEWTTPTGLTVTNRSVTVDASGKMQFLKFVDQDGKKREVSFLPVKQVSNESAAPPNVVHSLDADIVISTANEAREMKMPLAPIFDSFGTHVAHGPQVLSMVKRAILRIPPNFLNDQIFLPQGMKEMPIRPLPVKEFMKAQHLLGIAP